MGNCMSASALAEAQQEAEQLPVITPQQMAAAQQVMGELGNLGLQLDLAAEELMTLPVGQLNALRTALAGLDPGSDDNEKAGHLRTIMVNGNHHQADAQTQLNALGRALLSNRGQLQHLVDQLPDAQDTLDNLRDIQSRLLQQQALDVGSHNTFFRKCTTAQTVVTDETLQDTEHEGLQFLRGVPSAQRWKVLIDGGAHGNDDPHFYDRSKGYMASMTRGLDYIVNNIDQPMDADFLRELHTCAVDLVTMEMAGNAPDNTMINLLAMQATGYKRERNSWGAIANAPPEGINELHCLMDQINLESINRILEQDDQTQAERARLEAARGTLQNAIANNYQDVTEEDLAAARQRGFVTPSEDALVQDVAQFDSGNKFVLSRSNVDPPPQNLGALMDELQAESEALVENIFDGYRESVQAIQDLGLSDGERTDRLIDSCIDCCRRLGMVHPFKDANGRLFMFLTLNKLLMENGLRPTTLQNQGVMIGQTREHLRQLIKDGQDTVAGF
jgi:hypothetical protein